MCFRFRCPTCCVSVLDLQGEFGDSSTYTNGVKFLVGDEVVLLSLGVFLTENVFYF